MSDQNANDQAEAQAPMSYSNLVLGLSSAALSYMGFSGEGAKVEPNAQLARQNIDIISLLKVKTKGNLTLEEEKLTEQVLADLQMKYAELFG